MGRVVALVLFPGIVKPVQAVPTQAAEKKVSPKDQKTTMKILPPSLTSSKRLPVKVNS